MRGLSNALGQPDSLLTAHAAYRALAADPNARCAAYRALCQSALPDATLAEIRRYLQQQRALGSDVFQREVAARSLRFAGARAAHRPRTRAGGKCP